MQMRMQMYVVRVNLTSAMQVENILDPGAVGSPFILDILLCVREQDYINSLRSILLRVPDK